MRIVLILLLSVASIAEARMYQWTEPGVDTTQLSGKPPAWYRSAGGGPRVFVFENGRLIDDTAVAVSDEVRQRMRQQAFILAEEDRQAAKEKIAKAEELKQKYKSSEPEESISEDVDEKDSVIELITDALFPEEDQDETQETDSMTDKSMEELRAMITEWEKAQTESAKQAIE